MFETLTGGVSLMEWGEEMYREIEQAANAVALYLEVFAV